MTITNEIAQAELVSVAPEQIFLEDNIREEADLDAGFLASVREHGVLEPCIGYRNDAGDVIVRDGKSRVRAAREVGAASVPVYLTGRERTEQARVVEQLVTNEHRAALTAVEKVAAFRQLELAGLSVTAIAKATATDKATVKASIQVGKSDAATAAIATRPLTLDDALIFAEFEGDQEALDQLAQVADEDADDLPYFAERIRQERAAAAKLAEVIAEQEARGVRVIGDEDSYERLSGLTDAEPDAEDRPGIDPEAHAACPGNAVRIQVWRGGNSVDITPVCTEPTHHRQRWNGGAVKQAGPMTDEQKAERKELIANNKAWDAAEVVRREWVASLLGRKTLPKDAPVFVAQALTRHRFTMNQDAQEHAYAFLGIERTYGTRGQNALAELAERNPAKAGFVALSVALSAFENAANREWHRQKPAEAATYLSQLATWGYHLSAVEKLAAGVVDEQAD